MDIRKLKGIDTYVVKVSKDAKHSLFASNYLDT